MSHGQSSDAYASGPLPEHLTVAGWRVALIIASFTFSLPGFLNGAQTGLALGFGPAVTAALVAGVVLCAGACLTAVISVRTRLTTYLLVQRSFGVKGAALVNLVIAIVHYCWFGVNVSFFGDAMVAAAEDGFGIPGSFGSFVVIGSILITVSTIFGFHTLDRLAMVAVPLVGVILIAVCYLSMNAGPASLAPAANPPVPMSFGIALSALVGGNMLTVAAMPDLARFIRTEKGALVGMALSFPFAAPVLMVVSALIGLATGQTDIMKLVVGLGFGVPALLMLLLSVWTINALNLYSASLSMAATFPQTRQTWFILGGGAVGCIFALLGIINSFIPFLVALGLIIPPIAAIYVIDGFLVYRRGIDEPVDAPAIRWEAVAVWLGSLAVTIPAMAYDLSLTSVPALDATLLAAITYLIVLRVKRK
ncbi:cytosine permease [Niveispirillum cyanobacteriorum]|uniref:Cytosine permease n=1 Tax=Niveispirillum cyanobacteriorum TaxID=1612173 RepID=A0A2K9NJ83_9PROT|nr:cytosine permease [Niveispirillum cyanobacteriorum]AUN32656.1 cytosine permease [Niveispirillum cyanobacteriorum]GGE83031.1 cytosine permease [Niveispirillum cyanobacteriorum]